VGGAVERIQQRLRQRQLIKSGHAGRRAINQQIEAVKGVRQRAQLYRRKGLSQKVMQALPGGRV
jgi:hypothetical protein